MPYSSRLVLNEIRTASTKITINLFVSTKKISYSNHPVLNEIGTETTNITINLFFLQRKFHTQNRQNILQFQKFLNF